MYPIAHASVRNRQKNTARRVNIPSLVASCIISEESLAVTMTLTRVEYICID